MGWKLNLNDIAAAIGLAQLAKLEGFQARRSALDARYRKRLADVRAIRPLKGPEGAATSAHIFPILLQSEALRVDRDTMLRALLAENIGVGVHFRALPLHRFILSLPLYPGMTGADQDDVVEAVSRLARFYEA